MRLLSSNVLLAPAIGLALAFAPFGCGGDNSQARQEPDLGPGLTDDPFDCAAAEGLELIMVQDFEEGLATDFYTNSDGSEGSVVVPPPGSSSPAATEIAGGRCGVSRYGFQMTASNLSGWGMVFGLNFPGGERDLKAFDGLSFWARRGAASKETLFYSVFDPGTDPSGGLCQAEPENLADKCDAYGAGVGMSTDWRFFAIPFSDLRQRGFGVPTEELLTQAVIGFSWAFEAGDWDVWIDDVALYRSEGSGAGGAGP